MGTKGMGHFRFAFIVNDKSIFLGNCAEILNKIMIALCCFGLKYIIFFHFYLLTIIKLSKVSLRSLST